MAFDTYKTLLQDETGTISGPRTVMAGFGAGITESLLAVTPFESIKTTLWVPHTFSCSHFTVDTESLGLGLTIANQQIRACEVFYMAPRSSGGSEVHGAFSKASHQPPPGRLPTLRLDLAATPRSSNSRKDTSLQEKS